VRVIRRVDAAPRLCTTGWLDAWHRSVTCQKKKKQKNSIAYSDRGSYSTCRQILFSFALRPQDSQGSQDSLVLCFQPYDAGQR